MKIIDKMISARSSGQPFYSFEYFPPKTEAGLTNLYARLERMAQYEPLFVDITWGAGGSTADQTLGIAKTIQGYFGVDVMMHLTCTNMPKAQLEQALDEAYQGGIRNILALRGDPPHGQGDWEAEEGGFSYGHELTAHIRKRFGDEVGIAVGGYPEGHSEAPSRSQDILYLKQKVDAGADFIITQLFYDIDEFARFVKECRAQGIDCPIIPGMLPITNVDRFLRFTGFCNTKVPERLRRDLEPIRHDDQKVQAYGIAHMVEMCRDLMDLGVDGFHFYTLNLETSVLAILHQLGLAEERRVRRTLPWRPSTLPDRSQEMVRPIFWSNRPKSYTARTAGWDDFPNGRWGDAQSPAFGDLNEYYLIRQGLGVMAKKEDLVSSLGEPASEEEVFSIFKGYCEGRVKRLPWCEQELQPETEQIAPKLSMLNQHGFLTINSQPQVSGVSASDPLVGWGDPRGVVYQKAYIEFFVRESLLKELIEELKKEPSITYQAVNRKGRVLTNASPQMVNAVTWGVFPDQEIIQPTIVDAQVFMIWKDEAFDLWERDWVLRYPESSPARSVLGRMCQEYYLVNLVENDFLKGDIFKAFERCLIKKRPRKAGASSVELRG